MGWKIICNTKGLSTRESYLQNISELFRHVVGRSGAKNLAEQRQHLVESLFHVFRVNSRAALWPWKEKEKILLFQSFEILGFPSAIYPTDRRGRKAKWKS